MGGLRAGAETQTIASTAAGAAGTGARYKPPGAWRHRGTLLAYLLAGAVLFVAYLRLSETYGLNSDSANILLMAQDLLHGHLLLHGWYMSDVSFYPTEIPQYALLESLLGVKMQTAHVAAAMTYTLAFLLAVLLARSGTSGRAAWTRTLIAAGIMLAPQFGLGVFALDLSVGHIGSSVPLLLLWLLLDRATPRWYVPVITAGLLAWVLTADQIVYIVGIGPLALVCAVRVLRGALTGTGPWPERIAGQWYELSLGAAAVLAAGLAWTASQLIRGLGGYVMSKLPFYFVRPGNLHRNAPAAWKVLQIFGADYAGLGGVQLLLAFLHLASVIVVVLALLLLARRFFGEISLVDQVLGVAIVGNVALFLLTNAADLAAHEVAVIVPFGAALAARMLIRATGAAPAPKGARPPGQAGRTGRRGRGAGRLYRRVRLRARPALGPSGQYPPGLLAARASPDLRPRRLLGEQQRHREQRPAGQCPGPDAVHAEAGPVDGQGELVRPEAALRQLRRPGQPAGLTSRTGSHDG